VTPNGVQSVTQRNHPNVLARLGKMIFVSNPVFACLHENCHLVESFRCFLVGKGNSPNLLWPALQSLWIQKILQWWFTRYVAWCSLIPVLHTATSSPRTDSYEQLHGSGSPSPEIKGKHLMEHMVIQRNSATWKDEEQMTPTMQPLKGMKSLYQNYFCKSFW